MTTPQQRLVDTGNPLLAQAPVRLDTGTVWSTDGGTQTAILTIRTATTTLTVMLGPADLKTWARIISDLADSVSVSGLHVAGNGQIIPP